LEAAESGPCVIVGRCSDYILRNAEIPCLNVLIHSDLEHRIKRILERYGDITNVDVKKRIHKKDKQRRTYYRYYTDQHWGVYSNYDLALDSGSLGEETCIHLICELAKNMNR
ncbi:MAG: cytidylate kinase-like family protein, partial [Lachnospiraceae bacterium]|nr:cytidylate kinase-like family protein [Lachnospiraceae bacterium]